MKTIKPIMLLFSIIGFMSYVIAVDYETCEKDCINDGGIPRECHILCCVTSCTADGGSSSGCYSACTPRTPRGSCRFNDVYYPEGTIYGNYVCRQGEWITGACLSDGAIYPDGTTRSISGNNYVCQQGEWIIQ